MSLSLSLFFIQNIFARATAEFERRGALIVENFAHEEADDLLIEDETRLFAQLENLVGKQDIVIAEIFDKNRGLIASRQAAALNLDAAARLPQPLPVDAQAIENVPSFTTVNHLPLALMTAPIRAQNKNLLGYVRIGLSMAELRRETRQIIFNSFLIISIIVLSGLFASYVLARSLSGPILILAEISRNIEQGDYDQLVPVHRSDEIGLLAKNLTRMSQAILTRNKEIKEAQAALLYSSKMSALGEMSGGIAHEVNNPLAIIKLTSEQIKDLIGQEPLNKTLANKRVDKILEMVARMAKVVHGLRVFSREGRADEPSWIKASVLLSDTLSLCAEKFRAHGVSVSEEFKIKDTEVCCRPVEISQVLVNLLNNSYDVVSKMKEKWIKVEFDEVDGQYEFAVIDSGLGIPVAVQEKLFQPFFTTKGVGLGTGLGLTISKGILESHGGKIFVDVSYPHTRIVIRLPKNPETKGAMPELKLDSKKDTDFKTAG